MTRRRRRGITLAELASAGWFNCILLAERLPLYDTHADTLATCRALGERFVVEQREMVEAALAESNDTEEFMATILPDLVLWASTEARIAFRSRAPEPYR